MNKDEKMNIIRQIESSQLSALDALEKLDMPKSTYYRWKKKLRNMGSLGLVDNRPHRARVWNQLLPHQEDAILEVAYENPTGHLVRLACILQIKKISAYLRLLYIAGSKSKALFLNRRLNALRHQMNIRLKLQVLISSGRLTRHT